MPSPKPSASDPTMSSRPFVHLHCHSHYSLLDGASKIPDLVQRAKALGMPAVALTDHGNLYGAVEFLREAKAAGDPADRRHGGLCRARAGGPSGAGGGVSGQEHAFHLTLLARNAAGFRNLMRLSSLSFLEGFYYKPRIDKEILERHADGLICLSGCASAEFSDYILHGKTAEAEQLCAWYQKVFGEENFYVEIQDNGVAIQQRLRRGGDRHRPADGPAPGRHQRRPLPDPRGRRRARRPALHQHRQDDRRPDADAVRDPGVLRPQPGGDVRRDARPRGGPGHLGADRRDGRAALRELRPGPALLPLVQPARRARRPRTTCASSARRACASATATTPAPRSLERLEHELGIINRMGFASYFLIVWDFVRYAREQGIPALGPRLGLRRPGQLPAPAQQRLPAQVRPALRAVPRPQSLRGARHRHRPVPGAPVRGDRVRPEEVRRRQRRPDRHLRHAQGQGGDQGRRPGAEHPAGPGRADQQAGPRAAQHHARGGPQGRAGAAAAGRRGPRGRRGCSISPGGSRG